VYDNASRSDFPTLHRFVGVDCRMPGTLAREMLTSFTSHSDTPLARAVSPRWADLITETRRRRHAPSREALSVMSPNQTPRPKRWTLRNAPPCYALADAAALLGRSRPTLMRWLPLIAETTGYKPTQDDSGRWFVPVAAVDLLLSDGDSLEKLVKRASETRENTLNHLRRDLDALRATVASLSGVVDAIQRELDRCCKKA
jgi:hypothetical protein